MGSQTENLLTVIDIGSAKTCVMVAEVNEYALRYRGHGISDSRGMRKGVIADLDKAVDSIKKAVEEAENVAQAPVEHAIVGVAGSHIRGVNSHGGIALGGRTREISRDDVRAAVEKARTIPLPEDREPLHLLPQEFIVDGQPGVHDPAGLMGKKVEVRVHMVTASGTATQNVVSAANRAGIHVDDTVYEALACADSVLQTDERELGVCLADIGAGSTDLIVFYEGVVIHTGAVPIGGDHFTNDVAVGFRTPIPDAESIKKMFGCCHGHSNSRRQRDRSAFRRRPSFAARSAAHARRNSRAPRPRVDGTSPRASSPGWRVRTARRRSGLHRRRLAHELDHRHCRRHAAASRAAWLSGSDRQAAVELAGAGVLHCHRHDFVWTPRPPGAWQC